MKQTKSYLTLLFCFLSSSPFTPSHLSCHTEMALALAFLSQIYKAEKTDEPLHLRELKKKQTEKYTPSNNGWKRQLELHRLERTRAPLFKCLPQQPFVCAIPAGSLVHHPRADRQRDKTDTISGLIRVVGVFSPLKSI